MQNKKISIRNAQYVIQDSRINVGVSGLVVNQHGELLVIRRNDTRTWAIPGGSLDVGEMPTEGIVREVEEETGFMVLPVRLVAVHFIEFGGHPIVQLMFRCLLRGGEAKTSRESPSVGYVKTNPIEVRMLDFHKSRIEKGLTHLGKATFETYQLSMVEKALWQVLRRGIYPLMNLKRRLGSGDGYMPPDQWGIAAFVVIPNKQGDVLWVQRTDNGFWNLPGGGAEVGEAPWDAAVRETKEETGLDVRLTELTGVYTKVEQREQLFVFLAEVLSGTLVKGAESADFAYHPPGSEHPNTLPLHIERVADALDPDRELTVFKKQVSPWRRGGQSTDASARSS